MMNSKEFVNKIIGFQKEQINYYENKVVEDEKYPSLQQCHQEELKSTQEGLNHFIKIKQDLDRLEQLEKALDILKENLFIEFEQVDEYLMVKFKEDKDNEWDYTVLHLDNKEEYELLKEVLDCE